jgi:hypothetical protein
MFEFLLFLVLCSRLSGCQAPEATRPLLAPLAKKTKIEQKKGRVSLAPGVYTSSAYDDDEEGEKDGDIANTLDGGASTRRGSAAASKSFVKLEDNWDAPPQKGGMTAAELKRALTAMDVELAEIYVIVGFYWHSKLCPVRRLKIKSRRLSILCINTILTSKISPSRFTSS